MSIAVKETDSAAPSALQRLRAQVATLTQRDRSLIGLYLEEQALTVVQLRRGGALPQYRAAQRLPLPAPLPALLSQPKRLRATLKEALKQTGCQGQQVVCNLPEGDFKTLALNYRLQPHQDEDASVLTALRERLGDELGQTVIDYILVRPGQSHNPERTAFAVVANQQQVLNYLGALEGCGLSVQALEVPPVSLKRLVSAMPIAALNENLLIVHIGTHKTYLIALWGKRLLFARELAFSTLTLAQQLAQALEVPPATAAEMLLQPVSDPQTAFNSDLLDILKPAFYRLGDEINKALIYVASETRGGSIQHVHLCGPLACLKEMPHLVGQILNIATDGLDPAHILPWPAQTAAARIHQACGQLAIATGMALRDEAGA